MSKKLLYIIVGTIILLLLLIGIGTIALLPAIESANAQPSATSTPIVQVSATPTNKGSGISKLLKQNAPQIKSQIAQGLRLSPDQLTSDLQSGKTLSDIATAQNISSTQLQTIVAGALQSALKPAVDAGTLTQQQLARMVKRIQSNPNLLDHILGGKSIKQLTPTPTPGH
jgi:hypothetical protein